MATFVRYYLIATVVFIIIYGTLNYWTAQRTERFELYFGWETTIPFVPSFIYGYLSIFLVFILPVFSLKASQFRPLCISFVAVTFSAGVIYALFPAELAHPRPIDIPNPTLLYGALYTLALPHNLFPSLHISYTALILLSIVRHERNKVVTALALLWMLLIAVSVILIRQHHLVDILAGWILAWIAYKYIYLRFIETSIEQTA